MQRQSEESEPTIGSLKDLHSQASQDENLVTVRHGDHITLLRMSIPTDGKSTPKVKYGATVSKELSILPFCRDETLDTKRLGFGSSMKLNMR